MIKTCSTIGMKPVCDHQNWCKTDARSTYIGQAHHFIVDHHGRISGNKLHFPDSWNQTEAKAHMPCEPTCCTYTNSHVHAYCKKADGNAHWVPLNQITDILCVGFKNFTKAPSTAPTTSAPTTS